MFLNAIFLVVRIKKTVLFLFHYQIMIDLLQLGYEKPLNPC